MDLETEFLSGSFFENLVLRLFGGKFGDFWSDFLSDSFLLTAAAPPAPAAFGLFLTPKGIDVGSSLARRTLLRRSSSLDVALANSSSRRLEKN
jgi:hypothetical protein